MKTPAQRTIWLTATVLAAAPCVLAAPSTSTPSTSTPSTSTPSTSSGGIVLHAAQDQTASGDIYVDPDINSRGDRIGHDLSVSLSPLALAGGAFLLFDNQAHHGEARDAFAGIALTGVETLVLKKAINEQRPHGDGGGSFPSGHTSLAFSMATALAEYHPKYQLLAYGTAAAIGAARVEVGAHYWHDVVAGGALGYFTTKYFMHHHRGLAISPNGVGIQGQF